jgi:hypothetical protein
MSGCTAIGPFLTRLRCSSRTTSSSLCSANCQPNAAGASLKLGHHRHPQRRNAGLLALALSLGLALAVLSGQVAAPRLVSWLGRTAAAGARPPAAWPHGLPARQPRAAAATGKSEPASGGSPEEEAHQTLHWRGRHSDLGSRWSSLRAPRAGPGGARSTAARSLANVDLARPSGEWRGAQCGKGASFREGRCKRAKGHCSRGQATSRSKVI